MTKRLTMLAGVVLAVSIVLGGPVAAQPTSPDAVAAARELVVTMRASDQFKAVLPLIFQQLKPALTQGRPEVARDFDAVIPALQELLNTQSGSLDKVIDGIVEVYARNFTGDEMRQITAFYRQPVGQKLLERMPVITQESMVVGQQWGQSIAGELARLITEELRKRGHKL
jgi:hypothetical protein